MSTRVSSVAPLKWETHLQGFYNFMLKMKISKSEQEYTGTQNKNHTCFISRISAHEWTIRFIHKEGGEVKLIFTVLTDCVECKLTDLYMDNPKSSTASTKYMSVSEVVANGLGLCYVFAKYERKARIIFYVDDYAHVIPGNWRGLRWTQILHVLKTNTVLEKYLGTNQFKNVPRSIYALDINLPGWERQRPRFEIDGAPWHPFRDTSNDYKAVKSAIQLYFNRQNKKLNLEKQRTHASIVLDAWRSQHKLPQRISAWSQKVTMEYILKDEHTNLDQTNFRTGNGTSYQSAWLRMRF